MKYYVVKLLTNTEGEDGSNISVFYDDDPTKVENPKTAKEKATIDYCLTLANFINATDVLYAVLQMQNEYGNTVQVDIVDHKPQPESET